MEISLKKATRDDLPLIHATQVKAFAALLVKYQDYDTNPGNEPIEKIVHRFESSNTTYYLVLLETKPVGAIRIVCLGDERYRVSPIFILPEYQGQGIAQAVFGQIEGMYTTAIA